MGAAAFLLTADVPDAIFRWTPRIELHTLGPILPFVNAGKPASLEIEVKNCIRPLVLPVISSLALAMMAGCGGSSSTPAGSFPSLNGNFQIQAQSTVHAGLPTLIGGELTETSGAVTGKMHVSGSHCFNLSSDLTVTGTVTKAGALALTSSSIGNQVITIAATVSSDGSKISGGTYTIAGGCADNDKGSVTGFKVPAINGTYAGTFTPSPSGTPIKTTIKISQMSAADAHGFFHLTGSGTFNSSCFTKGSIAAPLTDSEVFGATVVVNLTTNEAGAKSMVTAGGTLDAAGKKFTGDYEIAGGSCGGDAGTGTLTLQ